jgi:hypothetical protein
VVAKVLLRGWIAGFGLLGESSVLLRMNEEVLEMFHIGLEKAWTSSESPSFVLLGALLADKDETVLQISSF